MTSITNAQLDWNEAGIPISNQFDDVYFSNVNGLEETRYVFLKQNHLPERWQEYDQRRFVIAETGFGTGLNFLAVWQWFDQFRQQYPNAPLKELHFISFEKYPLTQADLIKAHQSWPELADYANQLQQHYPIAVPECQRIVLADGAITLDLWFGDIKDCMPLVPVSEQGLVDAWFLDGFAPSKNPEMWSQNLFNDIARLAKPQCSCATSTTADFVSRGLIDAGFAMTKVKGFGTKREVSAGRLTQRQPLTNVKPWFHRSASDQHEHIAIIGGGVASATLAQTLLRRGQRVTLYCQDERAAQRASGNRQGAVYPLLNDKHGGVSRVFSPAFLFARQFVDQAAKKFHFDHDWCGITQLMWDKKSQTKLVKMLDGNFNPKLIHRLDAEQTSQAIGLPISLESIQYPLGGWLCPAQLTQGLLDELSKNPLFSVKYNHKVETLNHVGAQWLLNVKEQTFTHDCVVIANGNEFTSFEQSASIPLSQVKGQVSHIPTTPELNKLKKVLCYDGYITPVNPNNQQHCIGASYDRNHLNYEFDSAAQLENADKLRHCVPNEQWPLEVDTSANQSRQGIRSVSRDHLPFVGNLADYEQVKVRYHDLAQLNADNAPLPPHYPNLFCLLGLGSRGLSSAPLMAEVLASQICGDPLPLPVDALESLDPSRMWIRKLRKGKPINKL